MIHNLLGFGEKNDSTPLNHIRGEIPQEKFEKSILFQTLTNDTSDESSNNSKELCLKSHVKVMFLTKVIGSQRWEFWHQSQL